MESVGHDVGQLAGNPRRDPRDGNDVSGTDGEDQLSDRLTILPRLSPGERLVQRHRQAPDVRAGVDLLCVLGLLRRHVHGRAEHAARPC